MNNYDVVLRFKDLADKKVCCACENARRYLDVICCDEQEETIYMFGTCDKFKECRYTFQDLIGAN